MPRLIDLTRIRDLYIQDLDEGETTWLELLEGGTGADRLKTVAEDTFLRFAVGWESFVSDWFIGAINHDATDFRADLEKRLKEWLDGAVNGSPYRRLRANFPAPTVPIGTYPSAKTIREIVDPGERNIEFADLEDLGRAANRQIAQPYRGRVHQARAAGGDEIIQATLAIRNVLAHRSERSAKAMNEIVAAMPSYPALRKPSMSRTGIGTYLKAATGPAGEARLVLFKRELAATAHVLAP